jgi:hypothetical protein
LQLLRGDLAHLADQLAQLRAEVDVLKAGSHVSPLYSEAMVFAQQGQDARGIAGRCGISIGEAELVVALSRKGQGYPTIEDNEESEDGNGRTSADDPRR